MENDSRQSVDQHASGWGAQLELQKRISEAAFKRAKVATWAAIVSLALAVILVFQELIEHFGQ